MSDLICFLKNNLSFFSSNFCFYKLNTVPARYVHEGKNGLQQM